MCENSPRVLDSTVLFVFFKWGRASPNLRTAYAVFVTFQNSDKHGDMHINQRLWSVREYFGLND